MLDWRHQCTVQVFLEQSIVLHLYKVITFNLIRWQLFTSNIHNSRVMSEYESGKNFLTLKRWLTGFVSLWTTSWYIILSLPILRGIFTPVTGLRRPAPAKGDLQEQALLNNHQERFKSSSMRSYTRLQAWRTENYHILTTYEVHNCTVTKILVLDLRNFDLK